MVFKSTSSLFSWVLSYVPFFFFILQRLYVICIWNKKSKRSVDSRLKWEDKTHEFFKLSCDPKNGSGSLNVVWTWKASKRLLSCRAHMSRLSSSTWKNVNMKFQQRKKIHHLPSFNIHWSYLKHYAKDCAHIQNNHAKLNCYSWTCCIKDFGHSTTLWCIRSLDWGTEQLDIAVKSSVYSSAMWWLIICLIIAFPFLLTQSLYSMIKVVSPLPLGY